MKLMFYNIESIYDEEVLYIYLVYKVVWINYITSKL